MGRSNRIGTQSCESHPREVFVRVLLLSFLLAASASAENPADGFRINQVQALGSHNSYKQAIDPALLKLLQQGDPSRYASLEYEHPTLTVQLDLGLRKLELDVVHDPEGGRFARPLGLEMVREAGPPAGPEYDPEGWMEKPGLAARGGSRVGRIRSAAMSNARRREEGDAVVSVTSDNKAIGAAPSEPLGREGVTAVGRCRSSESMRRIDSVLDS